MSTTKQIPRRRCCYCEKLLPSYLIGSHENTCRKEEEAKRLAKIRALKIDWKLSL